VCPLICLSAKECTEYFHFVYRLSKVCSFAFLLTVSCITYDMTLNQLKMQQYETEFRVRIDWGLLGLCAAVIPVRVICVWLSEPCHSV
jgi:hypothetical protein